jgi:carbamoyl-phosphate synthase small subunit
MNEAQQFFEVAGFVGRALNFELCTLFLCVLRKQAPSLTHQAQSTIITMSPIKQTSALLALEDGRTFRGRSWAADGEVCGEIVFNTSMTGYQEVLTDPSYAGQIVCMTYPLIGNYGVNEADSESERPWVEGFVVREASRLTSNWRAEESLPTI